MTLDLSIAPHLVPRLAFVGHTGMGDRRYYAQ